MDGTDSSSRDLGGFLTVTNGAGMAADLTLTADADDNDCIISLINNYVMIK